MVTRPEPTARVDARASEPVGRRLESLLAAAWLGWLVVALGVLLRLARYLDNRSLWLDEALMSLNLLGKSFSGLLGELDYLQSAPPGFLLAERAVVTLLGDDELALRFVPLAGGIAALILFRSIAAKLLPPAAALLALTLFAVGEPLVYYSSEVKPYSTDLVVAVVLLFLYMRLPGQAFPTRREALPLAATGVVAVWFSYPSVFVLAGLGLGLIGRAARSRKRRELGAAISLGALWLASFVVVYLNSPTIGAIEEAIFEPGGIPAAKGGGFSFADTLDDAWGSLVDPGGFPRPSNWLAASVLAVGLAVTVRRRPLTALALAAPGALAFAAALVGKYPAGGRFWLFLIPFGLILLVAGTDWLVRLVPWPTAAGALLAAFVLAGPVARAVDNVLEPPRSEHVRPLLRDLSTSWRAGDSLYVHPNAQYALRYYTECEDCDAGRPFPWPTRPAPPPSGVAAQDALASVPPTVIVGRRDPSGEQLVEDLAMLRGRDRVWLLFTHDLHGNQEAALAYLDRNGSRLEERRQENATLFLYDLSR